MPTRTIGSLVGSDRVGFNTRTRAISAVTNATLDINGNRPIRIHSIQAAASGVRNTRGLKVAMSGGGLSGTISSNISAIGSTTSTTSAFIPPVTNFTGVPDTTVTNPSGNFTVTFTAHTSGANNAPLTNNSIESGTTGTTDDIRLGHTSSLNYWCSYGYYMVPTAPTSCSASFSGTTASVSWAAPSDNGETAITDYVIEYTTFPGFDAGQVFTTTTTSTSINIGVGAYATWYFRVYARNAVGSSQRSNTASATVANPPTWNTTSINDIVRVGTSYTRTLSVNNVNSTGFSLASGSLPSGLSLSSTGVVSGTPSAGSSQSFNFSVNATGPGGTTTSNTFTLNRRQALPVWTDNTLNTDLRVGVAYADSVVASGASSYTAVGLPQNGISLQPGGSVSGTPTSTSSFSFTINASNADGDFVAASFTFTPKAALAVWTDNTLATGTVKVGQSYLDGIAATNAASYAIQSGELPAGVELDEVSGEISGIPTTVGTYTFTLRATNASAESIFTGSLVITVDPGGAGKVWNGSAWVQAAFKVWSGSAWVEAPAKVWSGSAWVDPTA